MRPVILFRKYDDTFQEELIVAKQCFYTTDSRMDIKKGDMVVGRYSVLPFYKEQERDILKVGAHLINTYEHHRFLANIKNWYPHFKNITPKTWFSPSDVPKDERGFVLKGETNSKKFLWNTHMFADTWDDMMKVYCRLLDDTLIGQQEICIRKYEPLKTFLYGVNGLPITNEFRIFVIEQEILGCGYYWSNFSDDLKERVICTTAPPRDWTQEVIKPVCANFFVIDVAQKENGEWIVMELNDGQMSGLSDVPAVTLYGSLYNYFTVR